MPSSPHLIPYDDTHIILFPHINAPKKVFFCGYSELCINQKSSFITKVKTVSGCSTCIPGQYESHSVIDTEYTKDTVSKSVSELR